MHRTDPQIDTPYREAFEGLLSFSSFAETEQTIKRLENLCQQYLLASDKKGIGYCRQIASLGRRRAELISRNKRVRGEKRLQKREIADWFKIWLETPEIFWDWLALRKNTEEFRRLLESEGLGNSKSGDPYVAGNKKP
jgi:hypothetical protein